jgi:hypothetical protein
MFLQGKHFIPEVEGSLLNRSFKTTSPIGPRMLYSQSGMFVNYLGAALLQRLKMYVIKAC